MERQAGSDCRPLLLVVDDLFGRIAPVGENEDRVRLCGQFLLNDLTADIQRAKHAQIIRDPIADVIFHRGQTPACARVGDVVENDPDGVVEAVRGGWNIDSQRPWSLVLLDLCFYTGEVTPESDERAAGMPEGRPADSDPQTYFGLELLRRLHSEFPDLPLVILSSKPRGEIAERFARDGALAFLDRTLPDPVTSLGEAIDLYGLVEDSGGKIVGRSRKLLQSLRGARQLARNGDNLLIRGGTGSGKELLADYVRRNTAPRGRQERPFVTVNTGAQSEQLYYSELFGHRKGAFTGAEYERHGAIVEADGGDVFLDEIANMPMAVQNGMLRVLETGEVAPLGSTKKDWRRVSVRFLSATHGALEEMVVAGSFREDLYQRLRRGGMVFLPPLRERREDIPLLVEHFVRQAEAQVRGARVRRVSVDAMALLQEYPWPRNVRQLRDSIVEAVSKYPDLEHLLPRHFDLSPVPVPSDVAPAPPPVFGVTTVSLPGVVDSLNNFRFEEVPDSELAGRLPAVETALARFLVRYLQAGLRRHRRPDGKLFIQPAVEYLMGTAVTAASAYDLIKRLFRRGATELADLLTDPVLKEAYEKSRRGRPSRLKRKKQEGSQ